MTDIMTTQDRLTNIQSAIEKYGMDVYYDNYYNNTKGMEGWHSITFNAKTIGKNDGAIITIGNSIAYIDIEVRDKYYNISHIIIGRDIWYSKTQRSATDEETEKAIKFFEDKIEERKTILERARNNRDLNAIKRTIYDKFKEIKENNPKFSKITFTSDLKFYYGDYGYYGYISLEKNKFNEVTFKMNFPSTNTETFPTNYYEDGLTDHYYGREESWEKVASYFLAL